MNIVAPQIPSELQFHGTLEMTVMNGAGNGLSPSRLQFESEHSDVLESNEV